MFVEGAGCPLRALDEPFLGGEQEERRRYAVLAELSLGAGWEANELVLVGPDHFFGRKHIVVNRMDSYVAAHVESLGVLVVRRSARGKARVLLAFTEEDAL